jgi:hypothetical protein
VNALIGKVFDVTDRHPDGTFYTYGECEIENAWETPTKSGLSVKRKDGRCRVWPDIDGVTPVEGGFDLTHASNTREPCILRLRQQQSRHQ